MYHKVCFLGNNDSKQVSESKDSELEILRIEMEPSTEELGKKLSLLKAGTVSEFRVESIFILYKHFNLLEGWS